MKKLIATAALAAVIATSGIDAAEASGNTEPHAVTLWWVIFNNPDACSFNPGGEEQCGSVDVFGADFLASVAAGAPDPTLIAPNLESELAVLYATGARTSNSGRVDLTASIYRTPAGALSFDGSSVVDPMGFGRGFENPNAEVHLVVRDHGARVRGNLLVQITNFLEPFCSDPNLWFYAGENLCADVQFAVFGPAESGEDAVYAFADMQPVNRASATLIRNGDVIQAVVRTTIDTTVSE